MPKKYIKRETPKSAIPQVQKRALGNFKPIFSQSKIKQQQQRTFRFCEMFKKLENKYSYSFSGSF